MNKKYRYLIVSSLILFSFIAFSRILGNDFVNLDDNVYLTQNSHIKSGITIETIVWAFSAVVSGNWHPLTLLSHALDWSLFGADAAGHHCISLLLHIGAVVLLFLLLFKTTGSLWPSALAAALFALHPLRVESVAWAAERKDVLSMFFGMATLYAYAYYAKQPRLSYYVISLILFAMSLMSKPMLVTIPFILLLLDHWPLGRLQADISTPPERINASVQNRPRLIGKLLWEKIPFVVLTIVSSIVTIEVQSKGDTITSLERLPFLERLHNAIISYCSYLGKMFWPADLAVFYPYQSPLPSWQIAVSLLILIGITTAVVFFMKKAPFLLVGWLWYLGTLVPVIGVIQVGGQAMADRYTYLPSIGIALMIVWWLSSFLTKERPYKLAFVLFTGIAPMVLAFFTWQQCGYWSSSNALFNHALEVTTNNYLAHNALGFSLAGEGKNDQAITHFRAAIEINPFYYSAHANLAAALAASGKNEEAIIHYREAIKINPANDSAHNNLGVSLETTGKEEEALAHYLEAIARNPANDHAHYNMARLFMKRGNMEQAENHYRETIKINPGHYDAYYDLATINAQQGKINQAIELYLQAVRINPSSFKALNNLGVYFEQQLKHDEAIHYYRLALSIEPQNPGLHFNTGVALGNKGELIEAIEHFQRAIELKPDFEEARRMLKLAFELEQRKRSR